MEHGRLYTLRLGDGTRLPLTAWRTAPSPPWQFLGTCLDGDLCAHAREAHVVARSDGTFEVDEGTQSGRHDLDVRAVAEGLTVHHLRLAHRMAIALFRLLVPVRYPCPRCGAQLSDGHDPACHAGNAVPLFPTFDHLSWLDAIAADDSP